MTISLNVPATMKVNAEVSAMTVNSVQTMKKAMVPPNSISIVVVARDWRESKYGDPGSTIHKRSITSDMNATVIDITAPQERAVSHQAIWGPSQLGSSPGPRMFSFEGDTSYVVGAQTSYLASVLVAPPQDPQKPLQDTRCFISYIYRRKFPADISVICRYLLGGI